MFNAPYKNELIIIIIVNLVMQRWNNLSLLVFKEKGHTDDVILMSLLHNIFMS